MTEIIKYNEKEYPVKLGYYALKHTSRELKEKGGQEVTMESIFQQDIEVYEPLLYYSLLMGAHLEKQVLDIKREEMDFVLDACMFDFIALLPKFFPNVETTEKGELKKGESDAGK
jgi:hypothetical protein